MTDVLTTLSEAADRLDKSAVAIGNFDGVHIGHRAIFERVVDEAARRDADAVALTFEPHPKAFFRPDDAPDRLSPAPYKYGLIADCGIDEIVALTFDESLAGYPPERFVEQILVAALKAQHVVVGEDFRFGKQRAGDTDSLKSIGEPLGMSREIVEFVEWQGSPVSSTRIRRAVEAGDFGDAEAMLGRPFRLYGEVVEGDQRGRTLGFPTANIEVVDMALPPQGVYATTLSVGGGRWRSVTNVGTRPTFDGEELTVEAFVLEGETGDELDLYGKEARLAVHRRLRGEKKFDSPDELIAQIERDVEQTREFFDEEYVDGR